MPNAPTIAAPTVPALTRSAPVLPAATPATTAPSAPCTSAVPDAVPTPDNTLPVSAVSWPATTESVSATANGASSMTLMVKLPPGVRSPSASVTTTAKLTLGTPIVLSSSL